jgi:hypothetical protein
VKGEKMSATIQSKMLGEKELKELRNKILDEFLMMRDLGRAVQPLEIIDRVEKAIKSYLEDVLGLGIDVDYESDLYPTTTLRAKYHDVVWMNTINIDVIKIYREYEQVLEITVRYEAEEVHIGIGGKYFIKIVDVKSVDVNQKITQEEDP